MIDLRQDAPDQSDVIDPEKLSEELEKLKSIQAQIQEAEKKLKDLKSDEKVQSGVVIPKLMEDMNLSSLTLKDGSEVSIKKIYSATIKADKKAEAYQWLRNNGLGDILKMISLLPLAKAKKTRHWLMPPLQKVKALSRLKKRRFMP